MSKNELLEQKITEFNNSWKAINNKIELLPKTYPFLLTNNSININNIIVFNISLCFDEITEVNHYPDNFCFLNLSYAEIEKTTLDKLEILKHFPNFLNLQNNIATMKPQSKQYCVFGEQALKIKEEDKEENIGEILVSNDDLNKFFLYWNEVIKTFQAFYDDLIKYLENINFYEIDDTGIIETFQNNGKKQDILFKTKKNLYKISILSEASHSHSYANLCIKDITGFTLIKSINPHKFLTNEVSLKKNNNKKNDLFRHIIQHFEELAVKIET